MPPQNPSEIPIEDQIFRVIKRHSDPYLEPYLSSAFEELLWELQQLLGDRIKNYIPDPELSRVCFLIVSSVGHHLHLYIL